MKPKTIQRKMKQGEKKYAFKHCDAVGCMECLNEADEEMTIKTMKPKTMEGKGDLTEKVKSSRIRAVCTTDLIEGRTDYYLSDIMHNIKQITVNGKKIGNEIVFKLPEVPTKSRRNAIKVFLY